VLLFRQRVRPRQLLALAVSYAGVLLVFGHEAATHRRRAHAWARALVFGSALSYAVYLVTSGAEVQRWARCASPAGPRRGLRAVHRAVRAAAAAGRRRWWRRAGALAVAAQRHCCAPSRRC
jgi:hypothetical protein